MAKQREFDAPFPLLSHMPTQGKPEFAPAVVLKSAVAVASDQVPVVAQVARVSPVPVDGRSAK